MSNSKINKLAYIGLLLALALIFSYLEFLLPPFLPVPGFKLGLSQIPVLMAFYLFDFKSALTVSILKVVIFSLIVGYFFSFLFFVSLSGSLAALFFMYLFRKIGFSIYGVSVFSALGHNIGQFFVVYLLLGVNAVIPYIPFILLFSFLTGLLIGIIVNYIKYYFDKKANKNIQS